MIDIDPLLTHGRTEIYNTDAIHFMESIIEEPDLVFCDPPFNIGEGYEHGDSRPQTEFMQWLHDLCRSMHGRSVWFNLPDSLAADVVVWMRSFGWKLENWCIWHYRFGQCQKRRFINSKAHALWFSKGFPIVHPEHALVPSLRASQYGDDRTIFSETPGERMDLDVWGFEKFWGRVQGNNRERRAGHPNQLPELYLERIIRVCSDRLVADPCGGSGTTAVVGEALGRKVLTNDLSEKCCRSIFERLQDGAVRVSSASQSS